MSAHAFGNRRIRYGVPPREEVEPEECPVEGSASSSMEAQELEGDSREEMWGFLTSAAFTAVTVLLVLGAWLLGH